MSATVRQLSAAYEAGLIEGWNCGLREVELTAEAVATRVKTAYPSKRKAGE